MKTERFTLPRTGERPVVFEGRQLASQSSREAEGPLHWNWHEVALYETAGGQIVGAVSAHQEPPPFARKQQPGVVHRVVKIEELDFAEEALNDAYIFPPEFGFPPGSPFVEKQRALMQRCSRGFARAMSRLLAEAGFTEEIE